MFGNIRKECFIHFLGMSDISVILSDNDGKARLFVYVGDCTKALTSREYPTAELLQFCETYFKGIYQINGVPKEKAQKAALKAQPITAEFLRRNFRDFHTNKYSAYVLTAATTAGQTPVAVDVFLREKGDAVVYVYGEPDNVLNVHTVGELITFLNLCGLNEFVTTLKF